MYARARVCTCVCLYILYDGSHLQKLDLGFVINHVCSLVTLFLLGFLKNGKLVLSYEFYFILFLYSTFLLVICFIHIHVYMSIPISQFIPPLSPPPCHFPPLVSIRLFSTSVSLFLPCKLVHLYHFSRFHIYALIYDICFSLSDFHSV